MKTWDEARELAGMVEEDPNYYLEVQEKSMNSIQSHMDTLKATMQDFWYNFLNQDAINSGLSALNAVAETLSGITKTAQSLPAIGDTLSMALLGTGAVGIPALIDNIIKARQEMKKAGNSTGLFGGFGTGFKNTAKQFSQMGMTKDALDDMAVYNAGFGYQESLFGMFKQGFDGARLSGENFFKSVGNGVRDVWGSLSGFSKTVVGIGGALLALEVGTKVFDALTTSADESRKAASDARAEYDTQTQTLKENKNTIDSFKSDWSSLSAGVDTKTNENISLSTEDYERFLDLNNQIAEILPSTVSGFDSQGNAILNLTGSVVNLNNAFSELAQSQAMDRFNENVDDFINEYDRLNGEAGFWDQLASGIFGDVSDTKGAEGALATLEKVKDVQNVSTLKDMVYGEGQSTGMTSPEIRYLEDVLDISREMTQEDWDMSRTNGSLKAAIKEQEQTLESGAADLKTAMQDYLTTITEGSGEYSDLDDSVISNVSKLIQSTTTDQVKEIGKNKTSMMAAIDGWMEALQGDKSAQTALGNLTALSDKSSLQDIISANKNDLKVLSKALDIDESDLREQFNLKDAQKMEDIYNKIVKESSKFYKSQKNGNKQIKNGKELFDDFISSQTINTLDELNDLYDRMSKFDTFDDIRDSFIVDNFDITTLEDQLSRVKESVKSFKADWEALNEAIASSYTAKGMSSDEMEMMIGRFSSLEGYDFDKLFEGTFSGIHLNVDELKKLQTEFANNQYDDIAGEVSNLEQQYLALCDSIAKTDDVADRNSLIQERDAIKDQIEQLKMYQSEIEGTINTVARWQDAQSMGEKGDLYDTIADSGIEAVEERYKAGEVGTNEFKSFVEMMSNRDNWDTASIEDYVSTYEAGIGRMKSWFTEEPGQGLQRFLTDLHNVNSELAYIDDSGNWKINADVEAMADSLGVSEGLIDTILSKLQDMGFDIDFNEESDYLKGLREEAQSTFNAMDEGFKKKYDLDINADSIEDIDKQLGNIDEALEFTDAHGIDDTSESLRKMKDYLEALKGEKMQEELDFKSMTDPAEKAAAAYEKLTDEFKEKYNLKIDAEDVDDVRNQIENLDKAIEDAFNQGDSETVEELQAIKDNYESLHGGILDVQVDIDNAEDLQQVKEDVDYLRDKGIVDLDIDWDNLTPESAEKGIKDVTAALNGMKDEDGKIDITTEGAQESQRVLAGLQQALWDMNTESNILLRVDPGNLEGETQQIVAEFANLQQLANNLNSLKATPGVDTSQIEQAEQKLQSALNTFTTDHQAIAADLQITGQEDLDSVASKLTSLNATQTLITLGVDSSQIDGYQPTDKQQNVKAKLDKGEVETWTPSTKEQQVNAILNKGDVNTWIPATRTQYVDVIRREKGGGGLNGNAHANGNANSLFAKGKALAHGVWGAAKNSTALVGELGRELVVRGNRWFTIGDNGAEMRSIKKGDIVNKAISYSDVRLFIYLIAGTT